MPYSIQFESGYYLYWKRIYQVKKCNEVEVMILNRRKGFLEVNCVSVSEQLWRPVLVLMRNTSWIYTIDAVSGMVGSLLLTGIVALKLQRECQTCGPCTHTWSAWYDHMSAVVTNTHTGCPVMSCPVFSNIELYVDWYHYQRQGRKDESYHSMNVASLLIKWSGVRYMTVEC